MKHFKPQEFSVVHNLVQPHSLSDICPLFCSAWVNALHPISGLALFSSGSLWTDQVPDSGPANTSMCVFARNRAIDGGAMYSAAGYDMIKDSRFEDNLAGMSPRRHIEPSDTHREYLLTRRGSFLRQCGPSPTPFRTMLCCIADPFLRPLPCAIIRLLVLTTEATGGGYLHSGVLVELNRTTFMFNRAGAAGLAVQSLGIAENIVNTTFDSNTFFCSSGQYGYDIDEDEVSRIALGRPCRLSYCSLLWLRAVQSEVFPTSHCCTSSSSLARVPLIRSLADLMAVTPASILGQPLQSPSSPAPSNCPDAFEKCKINLTFDLCRRGKHQY